MRALAQTYAEMTAQWKDDARRDGHHREDGEQEAHMDDRMGPEGGQDAQLLLRVVHGVEPPERSPTDGSSSDRASCIRP